MRTLLAICLLGLGTLWAENEWELVWPESYPQVESLPLLDIASQRIEGGGREYLIGSRGGTVLYGYQPEALGPVEWEIVYLPVPFDITSVAVYDGRWLVGGDRLVTVYDGGWQVGGAEGWLAVQAEPLEGNKEERIATLASGWEFRNCEWNWATGDIFAKDSLVITGFNQISRDGDADGSFSWEWLNTLPSGDTIQYMVEFNEWIHVLAVRYSGADRIRLLRSRDAHSWEVLWEITTDGAPQERSLMVLPDPENVGKEKLHVSFHHTQYWPDAREFFFNAASSDGIEWEDTGSLEINPESGEELAWNPLELPEDRLHGAHPGRVQGKTAGNLLLHGNRIEAFDGSTWTTLLETEAGQAITRSNIASWDTLSFVAPDRTLKQLSPEHEISSFAFPQLEEPIWKWEQLMYGDGAYFGRVSLVDPERTYVAHDPTGSYELPFTYSKLLFGWSVDSWKAPILPYHAEESSLYKLVNRVGIVSVWGGVGINAYSQTYVWYRDIGWKLELGTYPQVGKPNYAFMDSRESWFRLRGIKDSEPLEMVVSRVSEVGRWLGGFSSFVTDSNAPELILLSCPDGETLFAHGRTGEVAIINDTGEVTFIDIRTHMPEGGHWIRDIRFINGWYYLMGSAFLRTRDFKEFEAVDTPYGRYPVEIVPFNGYLYLFYHDAVFRRQLSTGYLDATIEKQGWRRSLWFGWFQVMDEQNGAIEHLLLGDCWVKPMGDDTYWIRTATLGWIWMNKDWAPWLWRMDDGHWYWLDQDGWPPRAWDDTAKEWEELRP